MKRKEKSGNCWEGREKNGRVQGTMKGNDRGRNRGGGEESKLVK